MDKPVHFVTRGTDSRANSRCTAIHGRIRIGLGDRLLAYSAPGTWIPAERQLHINMLMLFAVLRALQSFHHHCQEPVYKSKQTILLQPPFFFAKRWRDALLYSTARRLGDLPFLPETPDSPDVSAQFRGHSMTKPMPCPVSASYHRPMSLATRRLHFPLFIVGDVRPRPVCNDQQQALCSIRLPIATPACMGRRHSHLGLDRFTRLPLLAKTPLP